MQRIDPDSGKVIATIEIGPPSCGGDIAAGGGSIWVSLHDYSLVQIRSFQLAEANVEPPAIDENTAVYSLSGRPTDVRSPSNSGGKADIAEVAEGPRADVATCMSGWRKVTRYLSGPAIASRLVVFDRGADGREMGNTSLT